MIIAIEFNRIEIDEKLSEKHPYYDEFNHEQFIVSLNIGEKVVIKAYGKAGQIVSQKEYIAKYSNCHINCQIQDKGVKKEIENI